MQGNRKATQTAFGSARIRSIDGQNLGSANIFSNGRSAAGALFGSERADLSISARHRPRDYAGLP
jgi:hypothetical protein